MSQETQGSRDFKRVMAKGLVEKPVRATYDPGSKGGNFTDVRMYPTDRVRPIKQIYEMDFREVELRFMAHLADTSSMVLSMTQEFSELISTLSKSREALASFNRALADTSMRNHSYFDRKRLHNYMTVYVLCYGALVPVRVQACHGRPDWMPPVEMMPCVRKSDGKLFL